MRGSLVRVVLVSALALVVTACAGGGSGGGGLAVLVDALNRRRESRAG